MSGFEAAKPPEKPAGAALVPELRNLFGEHPGLIASGPETLRRALRTFRRVDACAFEVEAARMALEVEGEVLD